MRPSVHFLMLWVIYVTVIVGCNSSTEARKNEISSKEGTPAFLKSFSEFEFVGSGPISDIVVATPHDLSSKIFPSHLETRLQYIFHHHHFNEDEGNPFKILQDRLKANGVTILDAKIVGYRFIGGPEFIISFRLCCTNTGPSH